MSTRYTNLVLFEELQRQIAEERRRQQHDAAAAAAKLAAAFEPIRQAWEDVRSIAGLRMRSSLTGDQTESLIPSTIRDCLLTLPADPNQLHRGYYRYYVDPEEGYTREFAEPTGYASTKTYQHYADAEELIRVMYRDIAENQAG